MNCTRKMTVVFVTVLLAAASWAQQQQQPAPQNPLPEKPSVTGTPVPGPTIPAAPQQKPAAGEQPAAGQQPTEGQQPAQGQQPGEPEAPQAIQPIYAPQQPESAEQPAPPPPPPATGAEGGWLSEIGQHTYFVPSLRYAGMVTSGPFISVPVHAGYDFNSNAAASVTLQHSFKAGSVHYSGVAAYRTEFAHVAQAHRGGFNLGWDVGRFRFSVMDDAVYTPASSFGTAGLIGLGSFGSFLGGTASSLGTPGIGIGSIDAISQGLNSGLLPDQSVLVDGSRVANSAVVQTQYSLSARNSITAFVNDSLMRGINTGLLDFDQYQGTIGFDHRTSQANTVGVQYGYARYVYPNSPHVDVQSVGLVFRRQLSGRLSMRAQGGVQVSSLLQGGSIDNGVHGMGDVSVVYSRNRNALSAMFSRRVAAGAGVFAGSNNNQVQLRATHQFRGNLQATVLGGFAQNSPLQSNADIYSSFAGVELNRTFLRHFQTFFRYDLQRQWGDLSSCQVALCVAQPLRHVFAFGFTWTLPGWQL